MNVRTEKAIRAWLALKPTDRAITTDVKSITLLSLETGIVAKFTIASIIAKRYPKRKKVKK